MDKRIKEAYIEILKEQKKRRLVAEYNVQDMPDGSVRVGVQPFTHPQFVYMDFKDRPLGD